MLFSSKRFATMRPRYASLATFSSLDPRRTHTVLLTEAKLALELRTHKRRTGVVADAVVVSLEGICYVAR